jgi:hypothetical protein
MEPMENELYVLVIKLKYTSYQANFQTFPMIREWRTRDLFRRHSSKPCLGKYSGRRGDIIVLSNSEKFNPVSTETLLESHPYVKDALVI